MLLLLLLLLCHYVDFIYPLKRFLAAVVRQSLNLLVFTDGSVCLLLLTVIIGIVECVHCKGWIVAIHRTPRPYRMI